MVDSKPLLQDRPPAYNAVPGAYEYGPQQPGYGAIPPAAPPPYPYPDGQGRHSSVYVAHIYQKVMNPGEEGSAHSCALPSSFKGNVSDRFDLAPCGGVTDVFPHIGTFFFF